MIRWMLRHKLYFIGAGVGALAGFGYWYFVGCTSGSCAITSSPINSTVYFAGMGSLLFGMFKQTPKQTTDRTNP